MNKREFLESAKIYNENYDYSLLPDDDFTKKSKVTIICNNLNRFGIVHGKFETDWEHFIRRQQKCPKCSNRGRMTRDEFILSARTVHGFDYTYDKIPEGTVNLSAKYDLYCNKHKQYFSQTLIKHLYEGQGCPICRYEKVSKNKTKSTEEFIAKAQLIHQGKYDYTLVEYKSINEKVSIICPEHGVFEMTPGNHCHKTNPQGCPVCGRIKNAINRRSNLSDFIKKATLLHNNLYSYEKAVYTTSDKKLIITCPKHGDFEMTPSNHLIGQGCPKCGSSKMESAVRDILNENGIRFVEQKKFPEFLPAKYSVDFFIIDKKIIIECQGRQHFDDNNWGKNKAEQQGILDVVQKRDKIKYDLLIENGFTVLYYADYTNIVFPYHVITDIDELVNCIKKAPENKYVVKESKHSHLLSEMIYSIYSGKLIKNEETIIPGDTISVVLPEIKIAFDVIDFENGSELHREYMYYAKKRDKMMALGYDFYQIFEDEIIGKSDIVKSRIKNILSIKGDDDERIFARKCVVKDVNPKDAVDFLEENHLQGKCGSTYRYGLYYEGQLVSLMTFGKTRHFIGNNRHNYELLRFVNKRNTTVVGAASRLLKHFIKTINSDMSIVSYADKRWSKGKLYERLGFHKYNESQPNYYYLVNNQRKYRFNFRKSKLVEQGFDSNKSEHEIMLLNNIYRIYDAGALCYELKINKK